MQICIKTDKLLVIIINVEWNIEFYVNYIRKYSCFKYLPTS